MRETKERASASEDVQMQRKAKPDWVPGLAYEAAFIVAYAAQSVWRRVFRRGGKADIGG